MLTCKLPKKQQQKQPYHHEFSPIHHFIAICIKHVESYFKTCMWF